MHEDGTVPLSVATLEYLIFVPVAGVLEDWASPVVSRGPAVVVPPLLARGRICVQQNIWRGRRGMNSHPLAAAKNGFHFQACGELAGSDASVGHMSNVQLHGELFISSVGSVSGLHDWSCARSVHFCSSKAREIWLLVSVNHLRNRGAAVTHVLDPSSNNLFSACRGFQLQRSPNEPATRWGPRPRIRSARHLTLGGTT